MTVSKLEGEIKETTGKLTGDTVMQVEGTIEKGVAGVKQAVGGAVDNVTSLVGTVINTVTGVVSDVYRGVKKMVGKG
jgi:uncharacterized protein YjbJ (UPF0337 family)